MIKGMRAKEDLLGHCSVCGRVEELFELVQVGDAVELVTEVNADLAKVFGDDRSESAASATAGGLQ